MGEGFLESAPEHDAPSSDNGDECKNNMDNLTRSNAGHGRIVQWKLSKPYCCRLDRYKDGQSELDHGLLAGRWSRGLAFFLWL
ncbi:hypothetical protein PoB_002690800 [Plakobranchus ocellatus]|uniref:Uncharacterized protein n=1 Tax=Plakobranchus ocellatus TaxID=259542 RepID=A0AAV4A191_9GAST|nr:hypothetical protein PoB_002690800 [Plakobranchus ocellatus]